MIWNTVNNKEVASLDPLHADKMMRQIPRYNSEGNVEKLADVLDMFCGRADIERRSYSEIAAIVRDIGIVAGSIRRHEHSPAELVPELERVLLTASKLTDLPARDTLMHYTVWNPAGPRLRTYTDHRQEPSLIQSMRIALPAVSAATRRLVKLRNSNYRCEKSVRLAHLISENLLVFLSGLNYSRHHVDPDVFIKCFRPFFEPFTVSNESLRGPGAVTMPLHIFDFVLWGSSEPNGQYQSFTANYIPYNTNEFRHYYLQARSTESFLDKIEQQAKTPEARGELRPLLLVLETWFKRLRGFRSSHLKYANKAYNGSIKHNFKSGSGGHTTSDIEVIAQLTDQHAYRIDRLLGKEN